MSLKTRFLPILVSVLIAAPAHAQSSVEVRELDGMLSVKASNASATDLATELSEQLGISVVITGDAETRVNLDIVEEPLERALGKLSPSNMLVRSDDASRIIEVVLMMGESQGGSAGGNASQFLPSGSPADEVVDAQQSQPSDESTDPNVLRDPNRAAAVRDAAAAASSDANLPAEQVPPMYAEDSQEQLQIDPATGLPAQQ